MKPQLLFELKDLIPPKKKENVISWAPKTILAQMKLDIFESALSSSSQKKELLERITLTKI